MRRPCSTLNDAIVGSVYPQHQEWVKRPGETIGFAHELIAAALEHPSRPLPTALIAKTAKISDLLSSAALSMDGLLLSAKMRTVLEAHIIPGSRFLPITVEHRGKPLEGYSVLHVPAAVFPITELTPPSEVEAIIELDSTFGSADLWRLEQPPRYAYWFVSQPLRSAIEAAELTGIRFGTARLFR